MLWESENRAEQCRILQIGTVDAGNGTLFGTRNKRAIQRDHLTLVIGSGGMGAATIHAAVQKARQNLESDFDNYTKFILVDSDWREIARMEKEQVQPDAVTLVREFAGPELPIAKTAYIGHDSDSKGAVIGRYYCI